MTRWRAHARVTSLLVLVAVSISPSHAPMQSRAPASVLERFDFRRSAAVPAKLPRALQEISGLAVTPDRRVFAHGDERGVVSEVDPCTGMVEKSFSLGKPAARGDFEGIAIAGERFFLITSTGQLYETREGADGATVPFTVSETGFGKVCELEGLAYDPSDRVLLIGCKRSLLPRLRGRVTIFRWSLAAAAPAVPATLTLALASVVQGSGARSFHTSSLEREAASGHYVFVAGPERLLVEATRQGAVVASHLLGRQLHPQPEGVTFLGDSLLVIADEGGRGKGHGTITCFHRAR